MHQVKKMTPMALSGDGQRIVFSQEKTKKIVYTQLVFAYLKHRGLVDRSDPLHVDAAHALDVLLVGVAVDLLVLRVEGGHQLGERLVVALVDRARRHLDLRRRR